MNDSSRPQRRPGRVGRLIRSLISLDTPAGALDLYVARRQSRMRLVVIDRSRDPRESVPGANPGGVTGGRRRRALLSWRQDGYGLQIEPGEGGLTIRLLLPPAAAALRPGSPSVSPLARTGKLALPARVRLQRCELNPILMPRAQVEWEALAVFNAAAMAIDDRVHLIYRAIGWDGSSVFGHASTRDGVQIDEQSDEPVYTDESTLAGYVGSNVDCAFDYRSGPSHYGCEDPRLSRVDERIYMTYTAFDGAHPPGVALTSIAVSDFVARRWNWRKPVLISPLHQAHKNWVIFPERIGGKLALLHGISPHVQIEYLDTLDLDGENPIESRFAPSGDPQRWDNRIRGVGPPPLKTSAGWLLIYHAMDQRDPGRYKLGVMLLDLADPTRILARLPYPLLEPDARYENEGFKQGVVYACGAALVGDSLQVYYGGADTVVCVASVPLARLLGELRLQVDSGSPQSVPAPSGNRHADVAAKSA